MKKPKKRHPLLGHSLRICVVRGAFHFDPIAIIRPDCNNQSVVKGQHAVRKLQRCEVLSWNYPVLIGTALPVLRATLKEQI